MQRCMKRLRFIHYLLAATMIAEAAPLAALAQDTARRIENIRVQINGKSSVYIDYDLLGPTDQVFKVAITMKKISDSTFAYTPQNVAGDVGPSVFPGRNNRIVWSLAREFPDGIKEGEFYFSFTVEQAQSTSGGISTPFLIAGGAAIVGGILALILAKKGDGGGGGGSTSFPQPPGRP